MKITIFIFNVKYKVNNLHMIKYLHCYMCKNDNDDIYNSERKCPSDIWFGFPECKYKCTE
jgi:hypothetical protein